MDHRERSARRGARRRLAVLSALGTLAVGLLLSVVIWAWTEHQLAERDAARFAIQAERAEDTIERRLEQHTLLARRLATWARASDATPSAGFSALAQSLAFHSDGESRALDSIALVTDDGTGPTVRNLALVAPRDDLPAVMRTELYAPLLDEATRPGRPLLRGPIDNDDRSCLVAFERLVEAPVDGEAAWVVVIVDGRVLVDDVHASPEGIASTLSVGGTSGGAATDGEVVARSAPPPTQTAHERETSIEVAGLDMTLRTVAGPPFTSPASAPERLVPLVLSAVASVLAAGLVLALLVARSRALDLADARSREIASRERQLATLATASPIGMFRTANDSSLVEANERLAEITGYPLERLRGNDPVTLLHPDDRAEVRRIRREAALSRSELDVRVRLVRPDGEVRWVTIRSAPIIDDGGWIEGYTGACVDVTDLVAAEDALRASEERYRHVIERLKEVVFSIDVTGRWSFLSPAWERISGWRVEDTLGTRVADVVNLDDLRTLRGCLRAQRGAPQHAVIRLEVADGSTRLAEVTARAELDDSGGLTIVTGTLEDVTEAERTRRDRDRAVAILDATSDQVATWNLDGTLRWANQAMVDALGYPPDELTGTHVGDLMTAEGRRRLFREALPTVQREGLWSGETELRCHDGTTMPVSQVVIAHHDADGQLEYYSSVSRDISERKQLEDELERLALHDPLTGLANRSLLMNRLEQALARAARRDELTAVLFFDIDRFKVINDSLGHAVGDELLQTVAHRLRGVVRPEDTPARFGGDEFVVLCEGLTDQAQARAIADRIAERIREPVTVRGRELSLSTSIGIAMASPDDDAARVLRDADAAMYEAKELSPGSVLVFDDTVRARLQMRLDLETGLREAPDRDELVLHYQPIIHIPGDGVTGVEALLRWHHPERGLLSPNAFIPSAEESGAILEIGAWALREACRQAAQWRAEVPGHSHLSIGVNLSVHQLRDEDLVPTVVAALADSGLPAGALVLEITESGVVQDLPTTRRVLGRLRELGVRVAIDDFGTGYAPLTHLRELPVDIVKIDRSFVMGLGESGPDNAIVAAIVRLAQSMGLSLVAEGVETADQAAALQDTGCERAQGFHFARPLDVESATAFLADKPACPLVNGRDDRDERGGQSRYVTG